MTATQVRLREAQLLAAESKYRAFLTSSTTPPSRTSLAAITLSALGVLPPMWPVL